MKPLTKIQQAMFDKLTAAGDAGATFEQLGIRNGSHTLPDLIFWGRVEYVRGSEPWRYRVKQNVSGDVAKLEDAQGSRLHPTVSRATRAIGEPEGRAGSNPAIPHLKL